MPAVKLPIMIQDLLVTGRLGLLPAEGFKAEADEFGDGPRCPLLEIIDPQAQHTARYQAPARRRKLGRFVDRDGQDILKRLREVKKTGSAQDVAALVCSDEFIQASVFAGVLKTLALFENKEIMGRPLSWAVPGPLSVYPRRSELAKANSFYQRGVGLSFYTGQAAGALADTTPGGKIYPSLSRDALSHETAHAILDGIEPTLYDAIGPHPRALHEALSDLVAVLLAFKSGTLSTYVLRQSVGSLLDITEFSSLADQIGAQKAENIARLLRNSPTPLRSLVNATHLDEDRPPGYAPPEKPYELSQALSGALYHVLQQHHERLKPELAQTDLYRQKKDPLYSASGQAMMDAARYLRSVLFRALDFLPPGESSLADYACALLAVQQASYPADDFYRQWLVDECVQRAIVPAAACLQPAAWRPSVPPRFPPGSRAADLAQDDAAALAFIELNLAWLGMPEAAFQQNRFALRPSLRSCALRAAPQGLSPYFIFKLSWDHQEPNPLSGGFPSERWVRVGTALIIEESSDQVTARLSNAEPTPEMYPDPDQLRLRRQIFAARQEATTRYLARLAAAGQLVLQSLAPKFTPAAGLDENEQAILQLAQIAVVYSDEGGILRAAGTGSGLHAWE